MIRATIVRKSDLEDDSIIQITRTNETLTSYEYPKYIIAEIAEKEINLAEEEFCKFVMRGSVIEFYKRYKAVVSFLRC